jgi:hypothetical protein
VRSPRAKSAFLPKLNSSPLGGRGTILQYPLIGALSMSVNPVIACSVVITALASTQEVSAQTRRVEFTLAGPGS